MAANFWLSTHCRRWLFTRAQIEEAFVNHQGFTPQEIQRLNMFFSHYLQSLGRKLKVRFRVTATGITYFRRFYLRISFLQFDPYLLSVAALYLASKVEEFSIHSKHLVPYLQKSEAMLFPYTLQHLLESEAFLLEELNCDLIVFHPYNPAIQYLHDAGGSSDLLQLTWVLINDSYRTDLILTHPPYLIAIGCICVAAEMLDERDNGGNTARNNAWDWIGELNVDFSEVQVVMDEMYTLFATYRSFQEKTPAAELDALIARIPRRPSLQPVSPRPAQPQRHVGKTNL